MQEEETLAKEYCEIVKNKTGEIISINRALDEMKQFSLLMNLLHEQIIKKSLSLKQKVDSANIKNQ